MRAFSYVVILNLNLKPEPDWGWGLEIGFGVWGLGLWFGGLSKLAFEAGYKVLRIGAGLLALPLSALQQST